MAEEHPELLVLGRCTEEANSDNATMRCRGGDNYLYPDIYQVCCILFMHINNYEFKKDHINKCYSDSENIDLIKINYVGMKINVMQLTSPRGLRQHLPKNTY